jgi:hypothetical protein
MTTLDPRQATMGYIDELPSAPVVIPDVSVLAPVGKFKQCPVCVQIVIPETKYVVGGCVGVSALGLCFITPILGIVPFCCNAFKDVIEVCPNCRCKISTWRKCPL